MAKLTFTSNQVAQIFGLTTRAVTLWGERGCPKVAANTWDMKDVITWWVENIYEPENDADDIHTAKLVYWQAKARVETAKAQVAEGAVMSREEVEDGWAWRKSEESGMLAALALLLSPRLVGKNELEIREIINLEIWKIRDNFCRTGKYME